MQIYPINIPKIPAASSNAVEESVDELVSQIGQKTFLPDLNRNYSVLNQELVHKIVSKRESALPAMMRFLSSAQEERQITEGLYILDRMIDSGVKGIERTYPVISRFNCTSSPNIQVMLAGIYRKTQVPDGFGPLMSMLIRNTLYPAQTSFDPNEEVGGAILEYLRNKSAQKIYS